MKNFHLVIIDPQNDFCDPKGALYVPGADQDMVRLAAMIDRLGRKITQIHVTLDSHHDLHIAHPIFWKDSNGKHPDVFTTITPEDVHNGTWSPTSFNRKWRERALEYVDKLAANGKYPLMIWPPHCLIGSPGQNVYPVLYAALRKWETVGHWPINWITKGSNLFTEHYSAIKADVEDPGDPNTAINSDFLTTVDEADLIGLSGEASSHCLANTGRDAVAHFNSDAFIQKLVYFKDAASAVTGCQHLADAFEKDLAGRGMQVTETVKFLK